MKQQVFVFIFLIAQWCQAQIGGDYAFTSLNLTHSARSTALNGGTIAIMDEDVTFAYANPALLNDKMNGQLSLSQQIHFADIGHGFFDYGFGLKGMHFHTGINYISYGDFTRADIIGNAQETFNANEVILTLGAAKELNTQFRIGANVRFINSSYEDYGSSGFAFDIGGVYQAPSNGWVVSMVARNVGFQISKFTEYTAPFPIDLQLGVSKRMAHLPFRLSVMVHHLQKWDIRIETEDPIQDIIFIGEEPSETSAFNKTIDNLFRHFVFNGEFLLGKNENVKVRFGYNHQRKKELSVTGLRSLGGFSFGFGLKIKRFAFDYGVGYYHLAGAVNHISISTNLNAFKKKL